MDRIRTVQSILRAFKPSLELSGVLDGPTLDAYQRAPDFIRSRVDRVINGVEPRTPRASEDKRTWFHVLANIPILRSLTRTGVNVNHVKVGGRVEKQLIIAAKGEGIVGKSLANLVATVAAESAFVSRSESCRYDPDRARTFFKSLRGKSDGFITNLTNDCNRFFEFVYGYNTSAGKRLGNTLPGDGSRYRGRGVFQLTGKDNYTSFSAATGIDVVGNPELLVTDLDVSIKAAIWFWKSRVMRVGADQDIRKATIVVNPYLDDSDVRVRVALARKYQENYA